MKDGERLVWAAAFAQAISAFAFADPNEAVEQMGTAAAKAYGAVVALRKAAEVFETFGAKHEGWAMLRDMAGLSH